MKPINLIFVTVESSSTFTWPGKRQSCGCRSPEVGFDWADERSSLLEAARRPAHRYIADEFGVDAQCQGTDYYR